MATEQQLKTLDKYVDAIHELLIDQIEGIKTNPKRQLLQNRLIFTRMLGQMLYDAPKLHTGMVSVRMVEQKLKNFSAKACQEHHHTRQKGGSALIALVDRAIASGVYPSKDQVRQLALKYCQVHYTTVAENNKLRKHQKHCSSEAAYRRANIQLVHAPDLFTKRGKHAEVWKQEMRDKYQPVVDSYHKPQPIQQNFEWPDIIH